MALTESVLVVILALSPGILTALREDYGQLFELMEQYQDRPMDLTDASLVLVAERTGARQILTLDSDFLFYRIGNQDTFEVISVQ